MAQPKVGDPIPGTNLKYEEADIQNLQNQPEINAYGNVVGSGASGGTPTTTAITSVPVAPKGDEAFNTFLKTLQDKLLGEEGIISSEPSAIEAEALKFFKERETRLAEAKKELPGLIARPFEQRIGEVERAAETRLTAEAESRRGFATNQALIRQIEEEKNRTVADLEERKASAISTGNIQLAEQIEGLQFQQLQFAQQSKQTAFSNMMQVAGIGLNVAQEQRQREQQQIQNKRDTLNFLVSNNLTIGMTAEDKRNQEFQLGLPSGTLDRLKPAEKYEQVGNSLIRIFKDEAGKTKFETVFTQKETFAPSDLEKEWLAAGGKEGTGLTAAEYFAKIRDIQIPRTWGEDELDTFIERAKTGQNPEKKEFTYQEILDEISLDPTIKNKDLARSRAAKKFGIEKVEEEPEETLPQITIGEKTLPITPEEKKRRLKAAKKQFPGVSEEILKDMIENPLGRTGSEFSPAETTSLFE